MARTASASPRTSEVTGKRSRSPAQCASVSRVDVQANATIDRATVGATEIGDGTKVDNLVQVGHGSRVGEDTLLCAQTGLAGSSVIGNNVILAGQVRHRRPLLTSATASFSPRNRLSRTMSRPAK